MHGSAGLSFVTHCGRAARLVDWRRPAPRRRLRTYRRDRGVSSGEGSSLCVRRAGEGLTLRIVLRADTKHMFDNSDQICYSVLMRGGPVWVSIRVPVVAPEGWTRLEIHGGLRELERVQRELDAARALLITPSGTGGRDSAAEHARVTGTSVRTARDRLKVALVVEKVAGAGDALVNGAVSGEHLRLLAPSGPNGPPLNE